MNNGNTNYLTKILIVVIQIVTVQKHIFCEEESIIIQKEKFICVSLGYNCFPALFLKELNLRTKAFPFDWNISSLWGLCNILENDFKDFLNQVYFDRRAGIFNSKYFFAFAHDFPTILQSDGTHTEVNNYLDFLGEIQRKYSRRIARFSQVCNVAETVYFFRLASQAWKFDPTRQTKKAVMKLRDALRKKFPSNNWVLVVIDTSHHYKIDWNIDQIKNFYISDPGSKIEWENIFTKLGILY